jgi:hypothetical protein
MAMNARLLGSVEQPPLPEFNAANLASYLKHLPGEPDGAVDAAYTQDREDQQ